MSPEEMNGIERPSNISVHIQRFHSRLEEFGNEFMTDTLRTKQIKKKSN